MAMDKDYLVQLTNEVYRLTLLFPKKEPLRYKMRELADEILANLLRITDSLRITNSYEYTNTRDYEEAKRRTEAGPPKVFEDLGILDAYLAVAIEQNWVPAQQILNLQQEYSKMADWIKRIEQEEKIRASSETLILPQEPKTNEKEIKEKNEGERISRDSRQKKILEILKNRGGAQVWEIQKIFPGVTKRTLRRDFRELLNQGFIERKGERNETFYQLRG